MLSFMCNVKRMAFSGIKISELDHLYVLSEKFIKDGVYIIEKFIETKALKNWELVAEKNCCHTTN